MTLYVRHVKLLIELRKYLGRLRLVIKAEIFLSKVKPMVFECIHNFPISAQKIKLFTPFFLICFIWRLFLSVLIQRIFLKYVFSFISRVETFFTTRQLHSIFTRKI